ncbi:gamma-tocopherol methyltransferase [Actinidia rufa]|uniref:Gamma-tocopherol methyltransferase n=1 Tax=Actinidia rufa TaxID=165716 RepID=A0A7J0DDL1_9ERIC|nr:gamma-tocopherol methyltransferase [Actinidia rufa]
MASEREIFSDSGPVDLTAVDWNNPQHRRIVAVSLVQGTYCMQHDRRHNLQAVAPPWWESFNFKPVEELYDEHDCSIFGAIFEFNITTSCVNSLRQKPPRYVIAFRGTTIKTDTIKQDLKLDFQFIQNKLQQSTRFQLAMQAVEYWVSRVGAPNIWLAGHSLGSAIALVVGKNMVKEGFYIETYLFNPPFASFPIELLKNENLKRVIRFTNSVMKAGVAVTRRSQYQRSQIDHSFNVLSGWIPYLFVNPLDPICAEYIGYFEHRENMVEAGVRNIARHATQNSLGSLIFCGTGKDSEPSHLIPSAYLTINVSPTQDLKQAHGIKQWWKQNINCQFKQYQYRFLSSGLNNSSGGERSLWHEVTIIIVASNAATRANSLINFDLLGMCSPLNIDHTRSNWASGIGWLIASLTWKETLSASPWAEARASAFWTWTGLRVMPWHWASYF